MKKNSLSRVSIKYYSNIYFTIKKIIEITNLTIKECKKSQ